VLRPSATGLGLIVKHERSESGGSEVDYGRLRDICWINRVKGINKLDKIGIMC
jgi:hypothetical protein